MGKPKANAAADYLNSRYGALGVQVDAYVNRIQAQPLSFYRNFNIIIAGLDNIEARSWLNAAIYSLVEYHAESKNPIPTSIKPLFDGGTEGFRGQCRTIVPSMTSCFECSVEMFPSTTASYPLCTLVDSPRLPEHCIEYAYIIQWNEAHPNVKPDLEDPGVLQWIYQHAKSRAEAYGIDGVTYSLTVGVIKNIIPAVVSTNALIAAGLVTEVPVI